MRREIAVFSLAIAACSHSSSSRDSSGAPDAAASVEPGAIEPPSALDRGEDDAPAPEIVLAPKRTCPDEMVQVGGTCIDRWESQLVDKSTGTLLSPCYPPVRTIALHLHETWERERFSVGGPKAQSMPVPPLPKWQAEHDPDPMAVSKPGVVPNGYVSGVVAEKACANAGKRLCRYDEWRTACQGEKRRNYPYGDSYVPGRCNIFRGLHPAAVLHDDASIGHLDPRLNLVKEGDDPLLRPTGATETCKSEWGDDALFDMNGNLDEWVEDEKGRFVGGFFSRAKKDGCLSSVRAHPRTYFDYSTGVRCCKDAEN